MESTKLQKERDSPVRNHPGLSKHAEINTGTNWKFRPTPTFSKELGWKEPHGGIASGSGVL